MYIFLYIVVLPVDDMKFQRNENKSNLDEMSKYLQYTSVDKETHK